TVGSAELYDPTTGSFQTTGSMVAARMQHNATLLSSGQVLAAGGYKICGDDECHSYLASAELYDPKTGTFNATGSMATARSSPATLLSNGQVVIAGGFGNGIPGLFDISLASSELYDPSLGVFSSASNLATSRLGHTATRFSDDTVLFAGGYNTDPPPS